MSNLPQKYDPKDPITVVVDLTSKAFFLVGGTVVAASFVAWIGNTLTTVGFLLGVTFAALAASWGAFALILHAVYMWRKRKW